MAKILFVNACIRRDSRTLELANFLLDKLQGTVEEVKLGDIDLCPLDLTGMAIRGKAMETKDFSDSAFDLAKQFVGAEIILIAAPYWDLMFPAVLKTYLENICVAGLAFRYSSEGIPVGLCKAKCVYYITTAGGYIGENNFGFSYVDALCRQLLGIKQIRGFWAQGLDISPELAEKAMTRAKEEISQAL